MIYFRFILLSRNNGGAVYLDKTASALEFLSDQFQNIPLIFHQIILMNSSFFR